MDKLVSLCSAINSGKNEEAKALINELGTEAMYSGGAPLNYAVLYKNKEIFDYLMERNADVNALYGGDSSCLMAAAENEDEYMMTSLIKKGARIDHLDKYGQSPFYRAALHSMGNYDLMKFFLDNGADASDTGVMELAKSRGKKKIVQLLEQYQKVAKKTPAETPKPADEKPDLSDEGAVLKYIWKTLVPKRGPAATVQGELLSAVEKIRYECADNGGANWDERFPQRGEFVRSTLVADDGFSVDEKEEIEAAVGTILDAAGGYYEDDLYDLLGTYIYKFYVRHQEPIPFTPPANYK